MRLILILLLVLACLPLTAQETENGASLRLVCQTETGYRLEVSAYGAVDTVYIVPSHTDAIEWSVSSEVAYFAIPFENDSVSLVVYAGGGAFNGASLELEQVGQCGESSNEAIDIRPMIIEMLKSLMLRGGR